MNRLKAIRLLNGKKQQEVSKALGISQAAYSAWEAGKVKIADKYRKVLSEIYNLPAAYILGETDNAMEDEPANSFAPRFCTVPVVGRIPCGLPQTAIEEHGEYVQKPEEVRADFALICYGDSMINARIYDGDIVYIRKQDFVDDGEIAAVMIDDDATLKRVRIYPDHIILQPENPMYKPIVYWGEEMNSVHIIGKAVAFLGKVK